MIHFDSLTRFDPWCGLIRGTGNVPIQDPLVLKCIALNVSLVSCEKIISLVSENLLYIHRVTFKIIHIYGFMYVALHPQCILIIFHSYSHKYYDRIKLKYPFT